MEKVSIKGFKVYQAINAVQMDLFRAGGIGKNQQNTQQRYKFRGIDDVLNALSPLLAKNGLVVLPEVLGRQVSEKTSNNGKPLFYVTVKVKFTFISSEDGSSHDVVVYGEAMDSGDKATNKAMSAAYKYMAIQSFCIATEGDNDADMTTHELNNHGQQQPAQRPRQNRPQRQQQQNQGGQPQQGRQQPQQQQPQQQAQPVHNQWDNNTHQQQQPQQFQQQNPQQVPADQLQMIISSLRDVRIPEHQFCQSWNIQHIGQLPAERFDDVMNWIYSGGHNGHPQAA